MRQWEIYQWQFPHGSHPAVVLSPDDVCATMQRINLLGCSSQRTTRLPRDNEVVLDAADGLDWETLCRLDVIFLADKEQLKQQRGALTLERRRHLARQMVRIYGLLL